MGLSVVITRLGITRLLAQKGFMLAPPPQTNSKAPSMSFKLTGTVILANEG